MLGSIQSALQGMMSASRSVDQSATNIANASTPDYKDPATGDEVDLTREAVNLMQQEHSYKANIATIETDRDMQDELLGLFDDKA